MNTETEIKTDEQSESDLKRLLCNLPTRAKIQLIGGELKTCEITTIQYRCGGVYSITVNTLLMCYRSPKESQDLSFK